MTDTNHNTAPTVRDCRWPWKWITFNASGDATCCCHSRKLIGNLNDNDAFQLWNSPYMQDLRRAIIDDEIHDYCEGAACAYVKNSLISRHLSRQREMAGFAPTTFTDAVVALITYYYQSILDRPPDASGLAYHQDRIHHAKTQGRDIGPEFKTMAHDFLGSSEYLNKSTSDAEYVTTLYKTFLRRDPESAGLAYYLNLLADGAPRHRLLDHFVDAPEFASFVKTLGL
ncbi:hypothetical protein CCP4SC76_5600019 [Gammaproteobacteria bacterium]